MIDNKAVDEAAQILYRREHGDSLRWGAAPQPIRRRFRDDARAALEAVAPKVTVEWGWRRSPRGEVRKVPGAVCAADVYHKLQEDGRTWQGIKYQIVSREVTDWAWQETVSKTEGGKS